MAFLEKLYIYKIRFLSLIQFFVLGLGIFYTNESMGKKIIINSVDRTVTRYVLANGMTIIVRQVKTVPKVSIQLWYHVGSKDEKLGEKGIAHLIEHMIFKGTLKRSETDLDAEVHKLSGSCNAFTAYDYTGYLFNFPSCQFKRAFEIMADCMENARFDEQMLNSELKAVIQELKMNRDQYISCLVKDLFAAIFHDHPYHYPIIGFKQNLWTVGSSDLHAFYKKHYAPNNATLVVVGDVDPKEILRLSQEHFESIAPCEGYEKETFFHEDDIASKSATLYRDIQIPTYLFAFVIPGLKEKKEHFVQILEWVLGKGNGSRLYKKLVNELQYVTSLEVGSWTCFDHGLLFIVCDPSEGITKEQIKQVIIDEIESITQKGISSFEIERAHKKAQSSFYSLLESTEDQAYALGELFLATGDENYLFSCMDIEHEHLKNQVELLVREYLRPVLIHEGLLLPLPHSEKEMWQTIQVRSDEEDTAILTARPRTTEIEEPRLAHQVTANDPSQFEYPYPQEATLSNGIKLLYYNNTAIPKITLVVSLKAQSYFDPEDKTGLYNFITGLMTEGTEQFSADQLADVLESKGMSLSVYPGCVLLTVLKDDLKNGLEILLEILTKATFKHEDIEKVRLQLLSDLKNYWDDPRSFASYLVKQHIYKDHPYSKNLLGTLESIKKITREDLIAGYKNFIVPDKARIAIVGDFGGYNVVELLETVLGQWKGNNAQECACTTVNSLPDSVEQNYPINRDQVVLCFACPSINRLDLDYERLLIFDQIFGSGMLHSMHSRLFELRQQSGLFYTIDGSFISNTDEERGMLFVKTIVSLDRLKEAEQAIINTIKTCADTIGDQEFIEAKRAIAYAVMDNFASNINIARTFLYMDRFNLPKNYFHDRMKQLSTISKEDVQKAVNRVISNLKLVTVRIGRI
jgi:zinc protease